MGCLQPEFLVVYGGGDGGGYAIHEAGDPGEENIRMSDDAIDQGISMRVHWLPQKPIYATGGKGENQTILFSPSSFPMSSSLSEAERPAVRLAVRHSSSPLRPRQRP